MHIGILQCGHVPEEVAATDGPYGTLYPAMLEGHGFTFTLWSVVDGEFPPGPDAADGWLVSGSRHGAYEDHPWIAPLEALIRDIRDAGRPLVGICFGHQIIAQALGGTVVKFPGGWAVGAHDYTLGEATLRMNAWHKDQVTALPPGATVHGSSPFCTHAIVAHGPHILTVQAHPEFPDSVVETLIEVRGDGIAPPLLDTARAHMGEPSDARRVAGWLADVLKGADATQTPALATSSPSSPSSPSSKETA